MVRKSHNGSITVFGVLAMLLTMECILLLSEGARFVAVKKSATLKSQLAIESAFAAYYPLLWEEYHILGTDKTQLESNLVRYGDIGNSEMREGENILSFSLEQIQIDSYTLMTDGNGKAFQQAVSAYMKDTLLYETAKQIYGRFEGVQNIVDSQKTLMEKIEDALDTLMNSGSSDSPATYNLRQRDVAKNQESMESTETNLGDYLEMFEKLQKMGILRHLVKEISEVSEKTFPKGQAVSMRELEEGKDSVIKEGEWLDQVLLQQYLLSYLSYYGKENDAHALTYEVEYLIGGKENDMENLEVVANELLLIRQAANMLYLFNDSVKVEEAEVLAIVLATAVGQPELYEVVKVALLAIWAYGESILDVRGLFQGKKIPLLKSNETWTLALSQLSELTENSITAKESEYGLTYGDYLGIILFMYPDRVLCMRTMDMQEATIRALAGDREFAMDQVMIQAEAVIYYKYEPIFRGLETFASDFLWNYEIKNKIYFQYGF